MESEYSFRAMELKIRRHINEHFSSLVQDVNDCLNKLLTSTVYIAEQIEKSICSEIEQAGSRKTNKTKTSSNYNTNSQNVGYLPNGTVIMKYDPYESTEFDSLGNSEQVFLSQIVRIFLLFPLTVGPTGGIPHHKDKLSKESTVFVSKLT